MKLCICNIKSRKYIEIIVISILFISIDVDLLNAKSLPLDAKNILLNTNVTHIEGILNNTRRIINGEQSGNNRPYMVYLKLPTNDPKFSNYRRWLCGGVIVHEQYILTSAACIEDAKHFYVVSGTHSHNEEDDRYNNACIKNGAKKAVWKCIPRNYIFDGHENDNIRWMNNDIAIVKVEDDFDFTRRIRGCDFVPKPICYNNQTARYESPGSSGIIAGWGSTDRYNDWVNQRSRSAQELLETSVEIISKETCKQRWGTRYHNVIDNYMICTRDTIAELSEACRDKYVECTDIMYSDEETRRVISPKELSLHSAYHNESGRRQQASSGGFCENDHGGPLIHGDGPDAVVIGIISACLVKERTNRCYGPFLYTSVYRNRVLIDCAIYKDLARDCSKMFRSGLSYIEEDLNWADFNEGSTKGVHKEDKRRVGNKTDEKLHSNFKKSTSFDTIVKHEGVILRSFQEPLIKSNTSTTNIPNKLS